MNYSVEREDVSAVSEQGVALTGRNTTGPPCGVGSPNAHAPGRWRADRPRARPDRPPVVLQTTTDDRRQPAKQYWPIRRASNNASVETKRRLNFSGG